MTRVLLVDNYDSFTYNLVQSLRVLGAEVEVRTSDVVTAGDALAYEPTHLVVSPGPGRPEDAGHSIEIVDAMMGEVPVLGVCLGHQVIAAALGAKVGQAPELKHGKASPVYHDSRTVYAGLPNPFPAGRYHSLAVPEGDLPDELEVAAHTAEGVVMGIRHRHHPLEGVQFHPESLLTPDGSSLLENFLKIGGAL